MNTSEIPTSPKPEKIDSETLRTRINELASPHVKEGKESYESVLREAFDEVLFGVSRTIGKIEGSDILDASECSDEDLVDLKESIRKLKDLLP